MPILYHDLIRIRLRHSLNPLATTPSASNSSSSSAALRPLPPALLATLIAWGAKFSEHPILVQDRKTSPGGRSRIARLLLHRAREVAEGEKVHRVPSPENVVISMLMDPLQSRQFNLCNPKTPLSDTIFFRPASREPHGPRRLVP
jgi:hypothetical protein